MRHMLLLSLHRILGVRHGRRRDGGNGERNQGDRAEFKPAARHRLRHTPRRLRFAAPPPPPTPTLAATVCRPRRRVQVIDPSLAIAARIRLHGTGCSALPPRPISMQPGAYPCALCLAGPARRQVAVSKSLRAGRSKGGTKRRVGRPARELWAEAVWHAPPARGLRLQPFTPSASCFHLRRSHAEVRQTVHPHPHRGWRVISSAQGHGIAETCARACRMRICQAIRVSRTRRRNRCRWAHHA